MSQDVLSKNVYRLRKISGMSQAEVAEKAGLSRLAYVSIEKGKASPRSDTLHKIADALNVSIKDLFLDLPTLSSVRFRMSKPTVQNKKVREQEIIKIAEWLKNYNYLELVLEDKLNYKLSGINEKDPVKLAPKVRKKLKIDECGPVLDITETLNSAGIKLHFMDVNIDKFFGMSIGREDGGPAISVNVSKGISIERQIFTVAHELGHLLLHGDSYRGDILVENDNDIVEKEANIFASYFLMPYEDFINILENNRGLHWVNMVLSVKRYFKVSYLTVLKRLVDLKMAGNSIYRDFAVNYNRMYKRNLKGHYEPSALREPEGPANEDLIEDRLYNLIREAVEKEQVTLSKAAEILNRSNEEMRDLANSWEAINWKELEK